MPLAHVLYPSPTPEGWNEWIFQHYQDHLALLSAIETDIGTRLSMYQIYPFSRTNQAAWLEQHARQHAEMLAVYGIIGNDLTGVDFNNRKQRDSWLWLNFTEHRSVRDATGLTF